MVVSPRGETGSGGGFCFKRPALTILGFGKEAGVLERGRTLESGIEMCNRVLKGRSKGGGGSVSSPLAGGRGG